MGVLRVPPCAELNLQVRTFPILQSVAYPSRTRQPSVPEGHIARFGNFTRSPLVDAEPRRETPE